MAQVGKVRVCVACTQNCPLFHGTPKTSPTSFFKVIVHQNDLKILYIPPMFNRTMSVLVDKEITLKDSSGQRWIVTVLNVDGSFAFEEGWNVFSLDHRLEIGDFLVFNCIGKLHFDVKIYDESGCERLDFSKSRNQKKRIRSRNGSPDRDGMLVRQGPNASLVSNPDVPQMNHQPREVYSGGTQDCINNILENDKNNGSAQIVCTPELCEDPGYMTSLEFEDKERDENTCGFEGTMRITTGDSKVPLVEYGSHIHPIDATLCNKDSMVEEILGIGAASDLSELEMSGRNNSHSETNKSAYNKTSTSTIIASNRNYKCLPFCFLSGEMKLPVDMTPKLCSFKDKLHATGKISEKSEKEIVTPDVCKHKDKLGATGLPKVIKGELGHSSHKFDEDNESNFETAATVSCVVPTDNDCLKLPTSLPLSHWGWVRKERMVVLLRDPLMRLWPVLYHEKSMLKILTHGWSDFQRANNIQPADVCVFQVENESQRIFNVHIVHKGYS